MREEAELQEGRRRLEADLEKHATAPLDEADAEGQLEKVSACVAEAQKVGVSGELIERAKAHKREWKRELHQKELDAELSKFTPVIELAGALEGQADDFDALLATVDMEVADATVQSDKQLVAAASART